MILLVLAAVVADPVVPAQEATRAWWRCAYVEAAHMAASAETAETIASAALGACQDQEDTAFVAWGRVPYAPDDRGMPDLRRVLRQGVLASVVKLRLAPPKSH